jgi:glycerate kinase
MYHKIDKEITHGGTSKSDKSNAKALNTTAEIAKIIKKHNKKMIVISDALEDGYEKFYKYGITSIFSGVSNISTLNNAIKQTKKNLYNISYSVARLLYNT